MEVVQKVKSRAVPAFHAAANSNEAKELASRVSDFFVALLVCLKTVLRFLEPLAARLVKKVSSMFKERESSASGVQKTACKAVRSGLVGVSRAAGCASGMKDNYEGPCKDAVRFSAAAFEHTVKWIEEPPEDTAAADRVLEKAPRPIATIREAVGTPESQQLRSASVSLMMAMYAGLLAIIAFIAPSVAELVARLVKHLEHRRSVAGAMEARTLSALTSVSKAVHASGDVAMTVASSYSGPGCKTARSVATAHKSIVTWVADAANVRQPAATVAPATELAQTVSSPARGSVVISEVISEDLPAELKDETEKKND